MSLVHLGRLVQVVLAGRVASGAEVNIRAHLANGLQMRLLGSWKHIG